jgi:hypothetical protein
MVKIENPSGVGFSGTGWARQKAGLGGSLPEKRHRESLCGIFVHQLRLNIKNGQSMFALPGEPCD